MKWLEVPEVSSRDLLTRFAPVGVFFGLSLGLGNAAYLFISVAFVQMLKAVTPVAVLLVSFAFRLEQPSVTLGVCILLISVGITVSCTAQVELSVVGTTLQLAAVVAEALRLGLVNLLLTSRGLRFSPLSFLYYVAPLCALALFVPWVITELPELSRHRFAAIRHVGALKLLANASIAFLLNLATMALIKHTSALTLNVSGVFKDLLLIGYSVVVSGAIVTPTQYFGYVIALVGVTWYSQYMRNKNPGSKPSLKPAVLSDQAVAETKEGAEEAEPLSEKPLATP